MSDLRVFRVVYHDKSHEMSCFILAKSRMQASTFVGGEVMHVSEGERVVEGFQFGLSGWNKSSMPIKYKTPSKEWVEYLKTKNTGEGFED